MTNATSFAATVLVLFSVNLCRAGECESVVEFGWDAPLRNIERSESIALHAAQFCNEYAQTARSAAFLPSLTVLSAGAGTSIERIAGTFCEPKGLAKPRADAYPQYLLANSGLAYRLHKQCQNLAAKGILVAIAGSPALRQLQIAISNRENSKAKIRLTAHDANCTWDGQPVETRFLDPNTKADIRCSRASTLTPARVSIVRQDVGDPAEIYFDWAASGSEVGDSPIQRALKTLQTQIADKASRDQWPSGSYVILQGATGQCPPGFASKVGFVRGVTVFHDPVRPRIGEYVAGGEIGASFIGCHGDCKNAPFLGEVIVKACVK